MGTAGSKNGGHGREASREAKLNGEDESSNSDGETSSCEQAWEEIVLVGIK